MKRRILSGIGAACFGVLLGLQLFVSSQPSAFKKAPYYTDLAIRDFCDMSVQSGHYTVCKVEGLVDNNQETDSVYGQYVYKVYRVDDLGPGISFWMVVTEGDTVVGIK